MVRSATLEAVHSIVAAVRDPELPSVTIEELGILRDVRLEEGTVVVSITPTYSGCPAMDVIAEDVASALREHAYDSRVETVLTPAWTTDWISDAAKEKLRAAGVGPPGSSECPRCTGDSIRVVSEFGSTACQALHVCAGCGEPFPHFKTLQ